MVNEPKQDPRITEFILFQLVEDQAVVAKFGKLLIRITTKVQGQKTICHLDFDTEKQRDTAFDIFTLRYIKELIKNIKIDQAAKEG